MQVIQELERQASRAKLVTSHRGVDLEYLKNIMLQLYQTGLRRYVYTVCWLCCRFYFKAAAGLTLG